ncbi:MAG: hypothetical protein KME26_26440 [Oscillatoria princeps RMCB-10]|jgi:glycosyltransferase involved in cell wall biosynthesis|nr:hypothetical protein [Oscillatoria princeps RMCB-10]
MKCALIEYNNYHDQTFPTLVYVLRKLNINVEIFTSRKNIKRDVLFDAVTNDINVACSDGILFRMQELFHKYHHYDFIIANSIEPQFNLSRILKIGAPTLAILHNSSLFFKEKKYKNYLSNRSTKLLVLTPYVSNYLSKDIKSYWIRPVYLGNQISVPEDKNVFCVQGTINFKRRNYSSLIEAVLKLRETGNTQFKIRIIGGLNSPDRKNFYKDIALNNIGNFFEVFEEDIPYQKYLYYLSTSDFILPLLDTSSSIYQPYFVTKDSSSLSTAIALNVPVVAHQKLAAVHEVTEASIVYEDNGLADAMKQAMEIKKSERELLKKRMAQIKESFLQQSVANMKEAIEGLFFAK